MPKLPLFLLLLCFCAELAQGQTKVKKKPRKAFFTLVLDPYNADIEYAKYYREMRQSLKPELWALERKNGFFEGVRRYPLRYDTAADTWSVTIPRGFFELRVRHPGFTDIVRQIPIDDTLVSRTFLRVDGDTLPQTYQNGRRFGYIRGVLDFSETLIVYASPSADPVECMTFLMEAVPYERIQKMQGSNNFLLTVKTHNKEPLSSLLARQEEKLPEPWFGYMIGDQLTSYIDILLANPMIRRVEPTYFHSEESFINPHDFAMSKYLKKKIEEQMQEGILLSRYLDKYKEGKK